MLIPTMTAAVIISSRIPSRLPSVTSTVTLLDSGTMHMPTGIGKYYEITMCNNGVEIMLYSGTGSNCYKRMLWNNYNN